MLYKGHPDQWFGPTSYSCCGEDLFITQLFWLMNERKPSYLDVGAHHPTTLSNTHLLYTRGSRGVNVEANPYLIAPFKELRPDDAIINIGIAPEKGIQTFYMWDKHSGRNTFSEEASKRMEVLTETIVLPVDTLSNVIKIHCNGKFPDFLNMDIEGLDYDVLEMTDLRNGPKIICVEVLPDNKKPFIQMLKSKGYKPVCRITVNIIFLKEDLFEICQIPIGQ